ncbi:methyl-accepting chemotaxis protein [Paenibacillus sp. HN-1]|uniref:methyl-accepting chemotaxis protein n=1 Tax=Paenibacillus TaxID=44249 RepID=UPI001CA9E3AB|nr:MULTISPECIES: methyl-accepting chemotaxis protein [Paenibacillus]MBY9079336.1 methyl-accepting chemotaxis protein [Paenibacillus sp. CGMCC 1.18879]MBY9087729.1 methyl-accepting chemotaxis protein [Paenibacillus sinensis]
MKDSFLRTNAVKVNKIITIILWLAFLAFGFYTLSGYGRSEVTYSLLLELSFITLLVFRKKYQLLTTILIVLAILTCTIPYIATLGAGLLIVTVLCVVTLYLNKGLLYGFGALYNISYVIIYHSSNHQFDSQFWMTIGFIELTIVVLFFVCKRSADLIQLSIRKEAEASGLLHEMDQMVEVIHHNTFSLNDDIANCNRDIGVLRNMSSTLTSNIQEVAEGVLNQSDSILNISKMMNIADEKMLSIHQLSRSLADTSLKTEHVVQGSSNKIQQMEQQMDIINMAVNDSLTTVEELNRSMNDINMFLSAINEISDQTNLLALNANIEAARAGQAGAGFAVVASQIRNLASQCSEVVRQIDGIVHSIHSKTERVFEKADNGSMAVREGEAITRQVLESFDNIKVTFENMNRRISDELDMTNHVSSIFTDVRRQAENISDIAQRHTAATEEMLATTQEQERNIDIIYDFIGRINKSSSRLQELSTNKKQNEETA